MEATKEWLHRLSGHQPGELREFVLPLIVPGFTPLALTKGIIATLPLGRVAERVGDASPLSASLLRYRDVAAREYKLHEHERLSLELGAILGLLTDRRVTIPSVFSLQMERDNRIWFLSTLGSTDLRLIGPMPSDTEAEVHEMLSKVGGLPDSTARVIGAAARLHQAAVQLFGTDVRSAYLLLVAGIEVMSREFGTPPTDWQAWDRAESWDSFFESIELSTSQREAMRFRLLSDTHLRLRATFRSYASSRLPDSFWDEPWTNWSYPYEVPAGAWREAAPIVEEMIMRDVLVQDRSALSVSLGKSYDLRSNLVHQGAFLDFIDVAIRHQSPVDLSRALPIAILRSILRRLICLEIDARTAGYELPEWRLVADDNA